jgi:hypothetical protein
MSIMRIDNYEDQSVLHMNETRSENPEISRRTTIPATRQRLDRMSIIGSISSRMLDFCKGTSRIPLSVNKAGKGYRSH